MQRNRSAFNFTGTWTLRFASLLAGTILLTACTSDDHFQYRERSDKILNDTGNAVASNIISQTVDPWSPYSRESETLMDGERARAAADRYRKDSVRQPNPTGASNGG